MDFDGSISPREKSKEHSVTERDFSAQVLYEAKRLFKPRERSVIRRSRMEKLVAFVAEDLKYNKLTRGWYKFGLYAPEALSVCDEFSNLEDLVIPTIIDSKELSDLNPLIKKSLLKFHDIFLRSNENFFEWVYSRSPTEYKNFYFSKMPFETHLDRFKKYFEARNNRELNEEYQIEIESVSRLYQNIRYMDDDEILDLFHLYMDLLEMSLMKLKNDEFEKIEEKRIFLNNMNDAYKGECGLLELLVPFKQTLTGDNSEFWFEWADERIEKTKMSLPSKLDDLKRKAISLDLVPTMRELREDANRLAHGKRESLREIFKKVDV